MMRTRQKQKPPHDVQLFFRFREKILPAEECVKSIMCADMVPSPANTPLPLKRAWKNIIVANCHHLDPGVHQILQSEVAPYMYWNLEERDHARHEVVKEEFVESELLPIREVQFPTQVPWTARVFMRLIYGMHLPFKKSIWIADSIRQTMVMAQMYHKAGETEMTYTFVIMPCYHSNANIMWINPGETDGHQNAELANQWYGYVPNCLNNLKILIWNYKGAAHDGFQNMCKNLVQQHNPIVFFISETKMSGDDAKNLTSSLGFPCAHILDGDDSGGGIWVLWDNSTVQVDLKPGLKTSVQATISLPYGPLEQFM